MTSGSGRRNRWPRTAGVGKARARPGHPRRRPMLGLCASALVVAWSTVACSGDFSGARGESDPRGDAAAEPGATPGDPVLEARDGPLPVVTPTPREMRWLGPDVAVPPVVDVVAADDVPAATSDALAEVLRAAGARTVRVLRPGERDRVEAPLVDRKSVV